MRRSLLIIALLMIAGLPAHARTSYRRMVARITRDAMKDSSISITPLGKAASDNRSIWLVRVADPNSRDEARTVRVLILCRQHGDEPASTEAALDFLDRVVAKTAPGFPEDLKRVTLYIVPMVNPDGADAMTRLNAKGVNLNRDWSNFAAPETRAVMRAYKAIHPALVLDMHSWDATDPYQANCIEAPRPTDLTLASGAPARLSIALSGRILSQMHDASGLDVAGTTYGSDSDPMLCHRYFLETKHTPAMLFETSPATNSANLIKRVDLARAFISTAVDQIASDPVLAAKLRRDAPDAPKSREQVAALFAASPIHATVRAKLIANQKPWIARVPKAVWPAMVLYGIGAAVIALFKPKSVSPSIIRLSAGDASVRTRRGDVVVHAIVTPFDYPSTRPKLTSSIGADREVAAKLTR